MKPTSQLVTFAALIGLAEGASWGYKSWGADWPSLDIENNKCGGKNQSPIDLRTQRQTVMYPSEDNFQKLYTNQKGDIEVAWNGHTSIVSVAKEGQNLQTFYSEYASKGLGGTNWFTGVQFHFHHGSEHTIDGQRQDLEMHTVHLAAEVKNDVKYAAMGIFFSVDDYHTDGLTDAHVATIDRFFDSLEWTQFQANPKVPEVPYGDLMMMVDMDNRWVYKGSVTTPPCDTYVYWNVLQRVYPIKQMHLDQFKTQLKRGNLEELGNYRMTMPIDEHDVKVISTKKEKTIDVNLNDGLIMKNQPDKSVKVIYNSEDGSNTAFNPKLDGTFEVTYADAQQRTFSYIKDGLTNRVQMCGWMGSYGKGPENTNAGYTGDGGH